MSVKVVSQGILWCVKKGTLFPFLVGQGKWGPARWMTLPGARELVSGRAGAQILVPDFQGQFSFHLTTKPPEKSPEKAVVSSGLCYFFHHLFVFLDDLLLHFVLPYRPRRMSLRENFLMHFVSKPVHCLSPIWNFHKRSQWPGFPKPD